MVHRRPKLAKATTEQEMMTQRSKNNERKKGSRQVLPLSAIYCYKTRLLYNSHLLFSKDVCLGFQWLLHISTIPSFLGPILYPKSPMFWCRLKKELPLVSGDKNNPPCARKRHQHNRKTLISYISYYFSFSVS